MHKNKKHVYSYNPRVFSLNQRCIIVYKSETLFGVGIQKKNLDV